LASVTWTEPALESLRETCELISRDSPRAAAIFAHRAFLATDRLGLFPASGRVVPEWQRGDLREIIFGNYRIIYRLLPDEVEVTAFVHGARQLGKQLTEGQ
jgi:plasmid stabilization system protein ParE